MRFKAVLFDVDGTLYRQGLLRPAMAVELALAPLSARSWRKGVLTVRIVNQYRHAHETLREEGASDLPLAMRQVMRTADTLGVDPHLVETTVEEWLVRRPLKYLRWCRRPGLLRVLNSLAAAGLELGVLSDYLPERKLEALEISGYFSLTLCTTANNVNALKPHPRGFQVACALWGLEPRDVLYVGDRPGVDGEGAVAAGLACAIIGGRRSPGDLSEQRWYTIRHLDELRGLLTSAD